MTDYSDMMKRLTRAADDGSREAYAALRFRGQPDRDQWCAQCEQWAEKASEWVVKNEALEAKAEALQAECDDLHWHIDNAIRGCQCGDDDACAHVRRAERAEAALAAARAALEKLSCIGNGGRPGNSDGNVIAQQALAAIAAAWAEGGE